MKEMSASEPSARPSEIKVGWGCTTVATLLPLTAGLALFWKFSQVMHGDASRNAWVLALIGSLLVLVALVIFSSARKMMRQQNWRAAQKIQFPDEPWRWRKEWADGWLKSNQRTTLASAWVFAILWNAISIPAFLAAYKQLARGWSPVWMVLIFPVVGLGLFGWAIRETMRWLKFGQSLFKMPHPPGVIGGNLSGVIETSVKLRPENGFHLRLRCINKVTTGSGKQRQTVERVLWEDEKRLVREMLEHDPRRSGVPVFFEIPADVRESDDSVPNSQIIWRLELTAAVPGLDYAAVFEVPVFQAVAGESSALGTDPTLKYQAPADPQADWVEEKVRVKALPEGGYDIYFPAARNLSAAIGLTIVGLFWNGGLFIATQCGAPKLLIAALALADVIGFFILANLWLKSSRVQVTKGRLVLESSWVFRRTRREFSGEQIAYVDAQAGMVAGNVQYYDVKMGGLGRETFTLGSSLRGRKRAESLAALIEATLRGGSEGQGRAS